MTGDKSVLVLGGTGGIGGELLRQLREAGWKVRALRRSQVEREETKDGLTWLCGDAMNREQVIAAASGCSVIVHAVNPPGYRGWAKLVLPMLDNTIAAAEAARALVVLPGTLYNYGPDALPVLREDSPQHPQTRKGAIRAEMERRLLEFTRRGGRALIVRAGDFFGPRAGNNWFSQGLIKPGRAVSRISYPGILGMGHQWSYLPDVARTVIELLERRDSLEPFATFHMAGQWDPDGTHMAHAIQRVVSRESGVAPRVVAFPWWLVTALSPFVTTFREMMEMRYLWREPIRMDNARLLSVLGREPHTPMDEAVEASLRGLGCLRGPPRPRSAVGPRHRRAAASS